MNTESRIRVLVLGACVMLLVPSFFLIPGAFAADGEAAGEAETVKGESADSRILAYYFHGHKRCSTCRKLEEYSRWTLEDRFSAELDEGALAWETINFDEPENEHYVKEFGLYTKALVLVEIRDGKQVRWKNLDRIWELVHNRASFTSYVERSVRAFLEQE